MSSRSWRLLLGVMLGTVLLGTAFLLISTSFMIYDDEGYLLQSYRAFASGHRLYDEVFSQYGPFPYSYHLLTNAVLGEPPTHTAGRSLTIVHWVVSSLLAGAVALKLSRNLFAGTAATLIVFSLLWQMTCEPSHPGSLITMIVAASALLAIAASAAERWMRLAVVLSIAAALLALTKINVGLFFLAGAGTIALRYTAWPHRWARPAAVITALGLLGLPWALMGSRLGEPRVLIFAIQFTFAAAGLLWVTPVSPGQRSIPPRVWAAGAACFAGTLGLVATIVCLRGTSVSMLLEAVLVDPLRLPTNFMTTVRWSPWIWPVTLACGLVAARAGWELRACGALSPSTQVALLIARGGAVIALAVYTVTWVTPRGPNDFLAFSLPLLPIFVVQAARLVAKKNAVRPLVLAALIALPQVLHAYPVAGSQMAWGTFLLVAIMVAGLSETLALARESPRLIWWLRIATVLPVVIGCVQVGLLAQAAWERYRTSQPLALPGAENIRVDGHTRFALRALTLNAAAHADVLFSRPGMFSYNLWSGVPPPTLKNATLWSWLLDPDEQVEIIDALKRTPRSALITCETLDAFLRKRGAPMTGSLVEFLADHYRPLFRSGHFTFHVPHDLPAVPIGVAEVHTASPNAAQSIAPLLLQAYVAMNGRPSHVQLRGIQHPWRVAQTYFPRHARMVLHPVTPQGKITGPEIPLPHDAALQGLFRLDVYADAPLPPLLHHSALTVVDSSEVAIAEACFPPTATTLTSHASAPRPRG